MRPLSGAQLRRRHRLIMLVLIGVTMVCTALASWGAREWAGNRAYRELQANAQENLVLQIEALTGVLEKYRLIPALLSKRSDIRNLFLDRGLDSAEETRSLLLGIAASSGAGEVLIADLQGTVLASARGLAGTDTISRSSLPSAVRQRRLGRTALRLDDGSRAYAFASHITGPRNGRNIGMIAVMAPFGTIEANWSLFGNPIFITDAREFVFLSNQLDWTGRPWQSSDSAPATEPLSFPSGDLVRVPERDNALYVEAGRTIPILGWTMHVLVDSRPFAIAQRNAAWTTALLVALVGAVAMLLLFRQAMNRARIRREKAQSMRLERIVRDRTSELSHVNAALRNEVDVRRHTEQQLRDTQDELIHTAKLAVIGQMSATLSHEYNQPLAAIKTYAGNAATMVAKGKTAAITDVLTRIEHMVDRMSALSRTLLSFSRKPGTTLAAAPIDGIVSEALLIVGQKAKKAKIAVKTDIEPGLAAMTGRMRLSQVIVNLVSNAVDAICGEDGIAPAGSQIRITAHSVGDRAVITISDTGPGIDPEMRGKVFEPFFTTKPVGSGLGLGLSIVDSIVRDLRGTIRLDETAIGTGACFVIELPLADRHARAAE